MPHDNADIYTHIGARSGDFCICCESLIFARDALGVHLEAVGISRVRGSKSEAIALANDLVRAAYPPGEHFQPMQITDGPDILTTFARPTFPDSTRVLDARVSQRGHQWLVNVYWSRVYP